MAQGLAASWSAMPSPAPASPANPEQAPMNAKLKPRDDGVGIVAAALGPLALYAATLPRTVVLEDDGLFLMAGEHLGVAHPPGYPLYTALCWLFMRLPGNPAVLGHLSSAVLGALACAALYGCARLLGSGRMAALGAAWLFGASGHFWSQAIIAEVYTLNALAFFACYALILHAVANTPATRRGRPPARTRANPPGIRSWIGAAAAFGLGLANHWPLMVLAAPGLALAAWPARRVIVGKLTPLAAVTLVCAMVPYLWMVLRSWQEPLVSFYGPIRDWDAFWFYLSRGGYAEADATPSAGWADRLAYAGWFCQQMLWQLTPPGAALAAIGFGGLLAARRFADAGAGALVLIGNSLVLIALLQFDFDAYNASVFRPYSLVCYGILALWLSVGMQRSIERLPSAVRMTRGAPAAITALAGSALVAGNVATEWHANNRADATFAKRSAEHLLSLLPENAVFFSFGDNEVGPLGYLRLVERQREDVRLFNGQGLVFGNRLVDPLASSAIQRAALRQFVAAAERPIFYAGTNDDIAAGGGVRHHGFVKEVMRGGAAGQIELRFHPASARYFADLVRSAPTDSWERLWRNQLVFKYGKHLGYVVLAADPGLMEQTRAAREVAEQSFFSLTGMVEIMLAHGDNSHLPQTERWLANAQALQGQIRTKEREARFLYLQGFLNARSGRMEQAIGLFKESQSVHPHPDNAAVGALSQLGQ